MTLATGHPARALRADQSRLPGSGDVDPGDWPRRASGNGCAASCRARARCCFGRADRPPAGAGADTMTYNNGRRRARRHGRQSRAQHREPRIPGRRVRPRRGEDAGVRSNGPAKGAKIAGADSPEELMDALERPRRILMMVPAGAPVDSVIAHLAAAPRARRHPDRRRQLATSPTPIGAADELATAGSAFRRHGRLRRRGRRAARAGDHAGRIRARRGTRWRRSSAPLPPRPTTASRASPTWARAAPGTT